MFDKETTSTIERFINASSLYKIFWARLARAMLEEWKEATATTDELVSAMTVENAELAWTRLANVMTSRQSSNLTIISLLTAGMCIAIQLVTFTSILLRLSGIWYAIGYAERATQR